jgi:hypothetical protein
MQIGQLLLTSQWWWWTILQWDFAKRTQKYYEIQKENETKWWWKKHKPLTMQCENHNENHNGIKYRTQWKMKMMQASKKLIMVALLTPK